MRDIWAKAEARGATDIRGLNHGNALSVYMLDPEGNMVEIYVFAERVTRCAVEIDGVGLAARLYHTRVGCGRLRDDNRRSSVRNHSHDHVPSR
ncbi:hypothetical protein ACSFA8_18345 [Variovorax sp. RT4R15]|uniref:hypothetical protein n=1 Tax=Variovorax sp. RT4R15 TaxID=3443737 RepID=UPI003F4506BC